MPQRLAAVAATAILLTAMTATSAAASVTGRYYGPLGDQATCEYWRGGVDPGGQNTEPCFYNPEKEGWQFYDRR